jgi:hypothetical protein
MPQLGSRSRVTAERGVFYTGAALPSASEFTQQSTSISQRLTNTWVIGLVWNPTEYNSMRLWALLGCFTMLVAPLIIASRLFLFVESFTSLRDVPSGVYATVPWAHYIPHI